MAIATGPGIGRPPETAAAANVSLQRLGERVISAQTFWTLNGRNTDVNYESLTQVCGECKQRVFSARRENRHRPLAVKLGSIEKTRLSSYSAVGGGVTAKKSRFVIVAIEI
jgi:hypothetical protein